MTQRLLIHYVAGLVSLVVLLGSCQPKQDTPQPNGPVPTNLLETSKLDSVITLTEQVDFSIATETGKGPQGSLIRWDNPYFFKAFTYNDKGRLLYTFQVEKNGIRFAEIAQYQGAYLTASYVSDKFDYTQSKVRVSYFTKYKYNTDKRLSQTLDYSRVGETNTFKLSSLIKYEYNAAGQLQLTRTLPAQGLRLFYYVRYWENGDCVRAEAYRPTDKTELNPMVSQYNYVYNKQINPLTALSLQPALQPSSHYQTQSRVYDYSGQSINNTYEDESKYRYGFDAQGRLVTMQAQLNWSGLGWSAPDKFTYVP